MLLSLVNVGLPNGYSTLAIDPHRATKSRSSSLSSQFPKESSIIAFGATFDALHYISTWSCTSHDWEFPSNTPVLCCLLPTHMPSYTSIQWTESRRRLVNPNLMSFHMSQASQTQKYSAWCFDGKPIGCLPLGGLHLLWYWWVLRILFVKGLEYIVYDSRNVVSIDRQHKACVSYSEFGYVFQSDTCVWLLCD